MKKYVIRPGDTMYSISKTTGIRLPLLLASNPQITNPAQVQPGMTIVIPELGKPAKNQQKSTKPQPTAAAKTGKIDKIVKAEKYAKNVPQYFGFVWPHVVQAGETVRSLIDRYGVTQRQIEELNPKLDPNRPLQSGTVLYIPYSASPSAKKPQAPVVEPKPHNEEGPHTHLPYRTLTTETDNAFQVPLTWDADIDESSSMLSSWNEWDEVTMHRSKEQVGAPDRRVEDWSKELTFHQEED